MSDYLDLNNEELLKDFFSEAEQQVETLESNILVIENDPSNTEAVDEIFRAAHTLKGGSATVEMHELSGFTHIVEDLLDELRSGSIAVNEAVIDVLLSSIDTIKEMLACRSDGAVYSEDVEPLKNSLKAFLPSKEAKKAAKKTTQPVKKDEIPVKQPIAGNNSIPEVGDPSEALSEYDVLELKESCLDGQKLYGVTVIFDESNPMNSVGGIQVFAALKEKGSVLKTIPDFDVLYEDEFQPKVIYFVSSSSPASELEEAAFLDDVTECTDAKIIEFSNLHTESGTTPAPVHETIKKDTGIPQSQKTNSTSNNNTDTAPVSAKMSTVQDNDDGVSSDSAESDFINKEISTSRQEKKSSQVHSSNSGSVLRVDSKRIDYLLNLVSETVITKASFNQIAMQMSDLQSELVATEAGYREKIRTLFEKLPDFIESVQNGANIKDVKAQINTEFGDIFSVFDSFDSAFKATTVKFRSSTQNLGRIAGELQEGVMKIRMVPISQIFSRFPRVVRDLSRDLDKKINLVIEGEDTELDKSVIEDLLDPIMHCVRNSIDHGIENPSERLRKGKNEEGSVLLKASNEGNMIVIDIIDDGAGIDVKKVRQKAIDKGLIHPNKILSDQEAFQLIFEPGFSTANKITNVSGRGVGLDVVRTQIEKLNGSVIVTSQPETGTKFSIRLPLTLAIIQGLLVRVGVEVYSIPIASVVESHRVQANEISTIDNYEVFNVRNEVISVLRLSRLFGIKNTDESEYSFIVIVGTADKKIGVMVDALIGEEDVVIKPLRDQFTNSPGIAGASILGDGSVSLIIDVTQLLELGVKQELFARQEREASLS